MPNSFADVRGTGFSHQAAIAISRPEQVMTQLIASACGGIDHGGIGHLHWIRGAWTILAYARRRGMRLIRHGHARSTGTGIARVVGRMSAVEEVQRAVDPSQTTHRPPTGSRTPSVVAIARQQVAGHVLGAT